METTRLRRLFKGYLDQNIGPDEEAELMQLLADSCTDEEREDLISECFDGLPDAYALSDADADRLFKEIMDRPAMQRNDESSEVGSGSHSPQNIIPIYKRKRLMLWMGAAAAVAVILLSISLVFFRDNKPVNEVNQVVEIAKPINKPFYKNDVKPGGNKAILTLADGTRIVLDDVSDGAISRQGNTTIIKLDNGRLAYNAQSVSKMPTKAILYNTITTPRGGQYCVTLTDGTIVWLNASTSLRFPTAFAGSERRVEIKGEAYFEVAKNTSMPFIVKAGNEEIKVLGTHFNVTAYADDKVIKTTLLEGRVQVSLAGSLKIDSKIDSKAELKSDSAARTVILEPGQQSQLDIHNGLTVVDADLDEAIAWKNGFFIFNNENIESIMLKISRWYDVKVDYRIDPMNRDFTGNISRTENVSEVLNMLEQTDAIHFSIEGKTITVLP